MWSFENIFVQFVKCLHICNIYLAEALIRGILANDILNMYSTLLSHSGQNNQQVAKGAKPAGCKQVYGVLQGLLKQNKTNKKNSTKIKFSSEISMRWGDTGNRKTSISCSFFNIVEALRYVVLGRPAVNSWPQRDCRGPLG